MMFCLVQIDFGLILWLYDDNLIQFYFMDTMIFVFILNLAYEMKLLYRVLQIRT